MARFELVPDGTHRWRIDPTGPMRVPGVVYASEALLPLIENDDSLRQVANVAALPGIVDASLAMPDVHRGYGFPIGGVAATDLDEGGVVSPGGVGFDISCGVRLHRALVSHEELGSGLETILDHLDRRVPRGLGEGGVWNLRGPGEVERLLTGGARFAVEQGYGEAGDLDRIEDGGALSDADPDQVSPEAVRRGLDQVGSLGSGNHFLEVQVVDEVVDRPCAEAFGLEPGQICVMIHTGSRGLGHQVCQDHVAAMRSAMSRYGLEVPDRQLACAPATSPEGRAYVGAMAASANFGRANRQLLAHAVRDAFAQVTGSRELPLVYDVSHNLAKLEEHEVAGRRRRLCVHRKGATLALPPGHPDLPDDLRQHGQPVLVPGSMGTSSWVMVGVEGNRAFRSSCHGAGRTMSRTQAKRRRSGRDLRDELEAAGIGVRPGSLADLPEEAPYAYKDVDEVVRVCEEAGLTRRVVRLRPLGVVKG